MPSFPLIDRYIGETLGVDLGAGETVVETDRRLRPEQSYGFVHPLYGLWFDDGRVAVSIPPGAGEGVSAALDALEAPPFTEDQLAPLQASVNRALDEAGLSPVQRTFSAYLFACNAHLLRRWHAGTCVRLRDDGIPPAEGLTLPTHCFPNGIVYGVIEDDTVVAVAYAHRTGRMEGRVADLGVKTAVSVLTAHVTDRGGEGLYGCSTTNAASIATARTVGYVPYATTLVLATDPVNGV